MHCLLLAQTEAESTFRRIGTLSLTPRYAMKMRYPIKSGPEPDWDRFHGWIKYLLGDERVPDIYEERKMAACQREHPQSSAAVGTAACDNTSQQPPNTEASPPGEQSGADPTTAGETSVSTTSEQSPPLAGSYNGAVAPEVISALLGRDDWQHEQPWVRFDGMARYRFDWGDASEEEKLAQMEKWLYEWDLYGEPWPERLEMQSITIV
jgi:hypothetical protein